MPLDPALTTVELSDHQPIGIATILRASRVVWWHGHFGKIPDPDDWPEGAIAVVNSADFWAAAADLGLKLEGVH